MKAPPCIVLPVTDPIAASILGDGTVPTDWWAVIQGERLVAVTVGSFTACVIAERLNLWFAEPAKVTS